MADKRDLEGSEDTPRIRVIDRRMLSDDERAGKVSVPSSAAPSPSSSSISSSGETVLSSAASSPPSSVFKEIKMANPNLVVYEGVLAATGPSRIFDLCSNYDYLRIDTAQGEVTMVKKVVAPHLVETFMVPGVQGRFVFAPTRQGLYLVGIRTSERIINGSAEAKGALGSIKRSCAALLVIGCMFALFIIGIPIIVYALMNLTIKLPSHEEVQRALQA